MKHRAISNVKRRRDANSVSLFPFLAVLICTMGVLILLLIIFTHQARLQAAQEAVRKNKIAEEIADGDAQLQEEVELRIELLKRSREKTKKQLEEVRLRLGLIEDNSHALAEKLARLEETRKQLEQSKADGRNFDDLESELAETRANIARVKADIEKSEREMQKLRRSHRPVIPHEGPGGTMRIPICIECRGDAVVLQPEGIELTPEDFDGPLGPGNPLAAALRAAREHMLGKMDDDLDANEIEKIEPYPLLLVRPDGTSNYSNARQAMKSWGPDFGYELIASDWKVEYGSPDPALAQAMQRAIDTARLEQVRLAAAAPKCYSDGGGPSISRYSVGRSGGVVAYRGPVRRSRYQTPGERLALQRAAVEKNATDGYASGTGSGGDGFGPASGTTDEAYSSGSRHGKSEHGSENPSALGGVNASGQTGDSHVFGGNGTGQPGGDSMLGSAGNGQPGGDSMLGGNGNGQSDNGSMLGNSSGDQPGGESMLGDTDSSQSGGGSTSSGSAQSGGNSMLSINNGGSQPGAAAASGLLAMGQADGSPLCQGQPGTNMQVNLGGSNHRSSYAGELPEDMLSQPDAYNNNIQEQQGRYSVARRPGEWVPSDPRHRPSKLDDKKPDDKKPHHHKPNSLAAARGKNWGLPGSEPKSTPLVRPIRIECYPNRLVVVPERGLTGRQEIVLDACTEDSVDEFVSAIWYYMDHSWGIAGKRMYWKPILNFDMAPGAEGRYADLKSLLNDSGLTIKKRDGNPLR